MMRLLAGLFATVVLGLPQLASAIPIFYTAHLTGPAESPPNASPGVGDAQVSFDLAAHSMVVNVSFSGLSSGTTASHIHTPTPAPGTGTAGVATQTPTFVGFPLSVTSGTYHNTFDTSLASTYNPAFVTANGGSVSAAELALAAGLAAGEAYLNIHTTNFPGGEIRGFLVPAAVPEPAALALLGIGMAGLGMSRTRRKV